jgi:hypothetical protein
MELHTIGIDLGKTVFHLVGLNQRGEVVVRKKFSRKQLLHFTANLQVKLIGMEACGIVNRCREHLEMPMRIFTQHEPLTAAELAVQV